jgi:hypothetical protein
VINGSAAAGYGLTEATDIRQFELAYRAAAFTDTSAARSPGVSECEPC